MFEATTITTTDKPTLYSELAQQARGLLHGETNLVANAANFAALVFHALPDINWCGFYFPDGDGLVVGPFQGKPACIRIALGRGVCGIAAVEHATQVVDDVAAHPNHVYCDSASRSEIVVPLVRGDGTLLGVWDVDSPSLARFDDDDRAGMEALCAEFMRAADAP
ncbi:MAG TPA: GAF domain-containing protein [Rhodanobacteraceae bacterium]|nr:GAF domain-containing protein [Rhodanobacteraceae bacterium]